MPAPRKIDLIPAELRRWLAEALEARGFGDIIAVTEELNFKLDEAGVEVSIGKSAVGDFSKALKDQREAMGLAETLLADMDIERESDLHKVLMQLIATSAVQLLRSVRDDDKHLDAKDLMALGRMLKDIMSSAGIREKLRDDERARIAKEARAAAEAEIAERLDAAVTEAGLSEAGLSETQLDLIRRKVLGVGA